MVGVSDSPVREREARAAGSTALPPAAPYPPPQGPGDRDRPVGLGVGSTGNMVRRSS